MKRWLGIMLAVALGVAAGASVAAPAHAFAAPETTDAAVRQPVVTANDAVRQATEAGGATYAGNCVDTRSPEDIGKVCSKLVTSQGDLSAYMTGRAFSEFTSWVFVAQTPAGWCAVGTASLDAQAMSASIPWPQTTPSGSVCTSAAPVSAGAPAARGAS